MQCRALPCRAVGLAVLETNLVPACAVLFASVAFAECVSERKSYMASASKSQDPVLDVDRGMDR